MNWSTILPALLSAIVSLLGLLFVYFQSKKNTENKIKEFRKEFAADLIKNRLAPYSDFMKKLEKASSIYEEEIIHSDKYKEGIFSIFQQSVYEPVGLLATHLTRHLLIETRKATLEMIEGKIEYDEWRKFPWAVALSMRNDLGIDQPGWANEIRAIIGKEELNISEGVLNFDQSRWINQTDLSS